MSLHYSAHPRDAEDIGQAARKIALGWIWALFDNGSVPPTDSKRGAMRNCVDEVASLFSDPDQSCLFQG